MGGEHAAPRLDELDLAARVPHDVVAAELVHHEHEEVRVGHRRHRAAERRLDVVARDRDSRGARPSRSSSRPRSARTRMPLHRFGAHRLIPIARRRGVIRMRTSVPRRCAMPRPIGCAHPTRSTRLCAVRSTGGRPVDARAAAGLAGVMAEPTPDAWRRVDAYLTETLVGHDPDLETAVAEQNAAGLPPIEVAPVVGQAAAPARAHLRRSAGARDRHARRLLDDLDGARHPRRRRRRDDRGRARATPRSPGRTSTARASGDKVDIRIGRGDARAADPRDGASRSTSSSSTPTRSPTRSTSTGPRASASPGTVVVVDNVGRGGRGRQPRDDEPAGDRHAARPRAARAATPGSTRPRCRRST